MSKILKIKPGMRTFVVAEVAQNHDGSLGTAHAYIDLAAECGADAVKFQTHIADCESSLDEPWRVRFSPQDATRFAYWKRMEFTPEQWATLKKHADEKELVFLSSPFSGEAVELLTKIGVTGWKIASGEINNPFVLRPVIESGLPTIISTGLSDLAEVESTVNLLKARKIDCAVLQCTSMYPCPASQIGLHQILAYREKFKTAVGLSDHSGTIFPGLAAGSLGAEVVEVHFAFDKRMFGPDVKASLSPNELKSLTEGLKFNYEMRTAPYEKKISSEVKEMRSIFTKSIVIKETIKKGESISFAKLTGKKPLKGIPASEVDDVVGATAINDLKIGHYLQAGDFLKRK